MLSAFQVLRSAWHVASDPLVRLNVRLAYSLAEGLITSPTNYPQPNSPFDMKNGQEPCTTLGVESNKRRKLTLEVSTNEDSLSDTTLSSVVMANPFILEEPIPEMEEIHNREILTQKVEAIRKWQWTHHGQTQRSFPTENSGLEFTLMCYNILAQELLECNHYLYKHCRNNVLQWQYRQANLIAEIRRADADIICLQEVQDDHYVDVFQPELKILGYDSLYKKRTGDKNDGCAIFFKSHLLALDSHVPIEYYQPGIRVLDRDNIGLIAVLKPVANPDTKLCVATTHLLFNPRRGDIKLAQLQVLLAELDKAAFKGYSMGKALYHPSIVCGDMNSEPYSPLYNFVMHGILHYYGIQSGNISGQGEGKNRGNTLHRSDILLPELGITTDCQYVSELECRENTDSKKIIPPVPILEHGFRFESAYMHTQSNGAIEVTTQHMKANCTVDYIFYSAQHLKNNPLRLLGVRRLLSDNEVAAIGGLPNDALSSDHLALVAKFMLKTGS